jgi:hypothetical protein
MRLCFAPTCLAVRLCLKGGRGTSPEDHHGILQDEEGAQESSEGMAREHLKGTERGFKGMGLRQEESPESETLS